MRILQKLIRWQTTTLMSGAYSRSTRLQIQRTVPMLQINRGLKTASPIDPLLMATSEDVTGTREVEEIKEVAEEAGIADGVEGVVVRREVAARRGIRAGRNGGVLSIHHNRV
jgi:hypothetical protein